MKKLIYLVVSGLLCVAICTNVVAESQGIFKKKKGKAVTTQIDSKNDSIKNKKDTKVKPYKEIIKPDMKTQKGFITVHSKDDKYYFEIPFSLFGRDILAVNRIAKSSVDMRNGLWGLSGDQIGESVYQFEKGPGDKIFLKRISFTEYANDSTKAMYSNVKANNMQAIAEVFPILAYNKDSTAAVVEVTNLVNSDNEILYFENSNLKTRAGLGSQENEKSYVKYIHSYNTNIEVRAVKTYKAGLNLTSSNYTVELNSSLVLLPEKPMRPRLRDSRVGYFTVGFRDFDVDPQGVEITRYATRWRLEPKPEDVAKYLKGELVEPKKPIVFYIDPTTPKKWVPYLIKGVNDWQKAFELAGFKNAIYAREAPTAKEDSTWSIDNAMYSAIIYRPSEIANAMGPHVSDPRSGEIIESHIFWYHNVMSTLKQWYMVQCGTVDPNATKPEISDELMGELIRFVSSHEVGHTLGLLHNFGSSSTVPVEKLRDKAWVEKNGHTPSIMDYARFNYVAQPEDHIGPKGLFPRINDYDKWAIYWGYKWVPEGKNEYEIQKDLGKMVSDTLKVNHRLWFGGETEPFDPRCQNEDLGDDAMKASEYGIKNLKRIVPQLVKWYVEPDKDYTELQKAFSGVFEQYMRYVGHVMKNIGGIYHNDTRGADKLPTYAPTEYDKQKRAVAFLGKQVFTTPTWLDNKDIFNRLPYSFGIELNNLQKNVIAALITRTRMSTLLNNQYESNKKGYHLNELFIDLDHSIFSELYKGTNVDFYKRNLQKMYVFRLIEQAYSGENSGLLEGPSTYPHYLSDIQGVIYAELRSQKRLIDKNLHNSKLDSATKIHLLELSRRINDNLHSVVVRK